MITLLKKQLSKNKLLLKIQACILAVLLWSHVSHFHTVNQTYTVPIFFYNGTLEEFDISALPDEITLTLRGSRFDLAAVNRNALALHIDLSTLAEETRFTPSSRHLFLPEKVSVIHCTPSPLSLKKKTKI